MMQMQTYPFFFYFSSENVSGKVHFHLCYQTSPKISIQLILLTGRPGILSSSYNLSETEQSIRIKINTLSASTPILSAEAPGVSEPST